MDKFYLAITDHVSWVFITIGLIYRTYISRFSQKTVLDIKRNLLGRKLAWSLSKIRSMRDSGSHCLITYFVNLMLSFECKGSTLMLGEKVMFPFIRRWLQ